MGMITLRSMPACKRLAVMLGRSLERSDHVAWDNPLVKLLFC